MFAHSSEQTLLGRMLPASKAVRRRTSLIFDAGSVCSGRRTERLCLEKMLVERAIEVETLVNVCLRRINSVFVSLRVYVRFIVTTPSSDIRLITRHCQPVGRSSAGGGTARS